MRLLLPALLLLWCAGSAQAGAHLSRETHHTDLQRVVVLVNEARTSGHWCGRRQFPPAAPLNVSDPLGRAAQRHAEDMARLGYFDHRAPDGSTPKDRVQRAGYQPRLTGENIAFGPESPEEAVRGWLDSPGHCENIMDARFTEIGIGLAEGPKRGHTYWVQNFGLGAATISPRK